MSFISDLEKGQEAQKRFAHWLIDHEDIKEIHFPQGKFKDYDIKIVTSSGEEKTYEIKRDLKAHETNNFVIETRCSGLSSGIYRSKADYIVYYVMGKFWIQERGELILRLIDAEKRTVKGGDGRRAEMYVIRVDELPNLFTPILTNENDGEMNNSN